jgi:hypothetical protein
VRDSSEMYVTAHCMLHVKRKAFWSLRDGHSLATNPLSSDIHSSKHLLGPKAHPRDQRRVQAESFCVGGNSGRVVSKFTSLLEM